MSNGWSCFLKGVSIQQKMICGFYRKLEPVTEPDNNLDFFIELVILKRQTSSTLKVLKLASYEFIKWEF